MRRLIVMTLLTVLSAAHADVLPPMLTDGEQALENAGKDPGFYNFADPFCTGKAVGSACNIPGNPFEGGGNGLCQRSQKRDGQVTNACVLTAPLDVQHTISDALIEADPSLCQSAQKNADIAQMLNGMGVTCPNPRPASDQYCAQKKPSDVCTIPAMASDHTKQYPGRCALTQVHKKSFYFEGRRTLYRLVLECLPEHPVEISVSRATPPDHK